MSPSGMGERASWVWAGRTACGCVLLVALSLCGGPALLCYRASQRDDLRHILELRKGMSQGQVERIAGKPMEERTDFEGNPLWIYNGYDVHFKRRRIDDVDPW